MLSFEFFFFDVLLLTKIEGHIQVRLHEILPSIRSGLVNVLITDNSMEKCDIIIIV